MKRAWKYCNSQISRERKRSAKYCSDNCYYEAKKQRSTERYAQMKAPMMELLRCENILGYLYGIAQLKKPISADDLVALNFRFDLTAGEMLDDKKRLFKIVGQFAYYIDSTKILTIWKLKETQ